MSEAIKVGHLFYTYPDKTVGLQDINLDVAKGETVIIIGANGTGKSTLLLNLIGILRGRGEIEILGNVLNDKNLRTIRKEMGLVFQNPDDQLFCPTVLDDVAFGPVNLGWDRDVVLQESRNALALVRMEKVESRPSHHLSFGEKKRVAIATLLSMKPQILLMDEPTGGLDPRSCTELIEILYVLKDQGKTILATSHDLHMVSEIADRVCVLSEEKTIVADGPFKEILSNQELLLKNNLIHQHRHRHERFVVEHEHAHLHEHDHENRE
ncbi:MAG TPA: energy-coupling factor ABC transporter ATP-binding protein [Candidatus Brocadiia bacterium]|nr:ABC transporter ATP-binding protein [Candidatus Brocadiales bacterium]